MNSEMNSDHMNGNPSTVTDQSVQILMDSILADIPDRLQGLAYHQKLGEIVEELPDDHQALLRDEVDQHLKKMDTFGASDIDLGGAGCAGKVWFRIQGIKQPERDGLTYTTGQSDLLLHNLILPDQRKALLNTGNLDFSYQLTQNNSPVARFRGDIYMELEHLALNMRRIDQKVRPFSSLELHPEAAKVLNFSYMKYGLSLVTGLTGFGKSSTLDSIIDAHNKSVNAHITIIASPVELIHQPGKCIIRHREVGTDVRSFKHGAVEALRQDPDIIVIGELRDPETIMTALEVTDSGHKTFSTLHTASAVESISRIVGEVPENDKERIKNRLADVLSCVISQKLVPSRNGKRILTKEVLVVTPSVQAAIRNNNLNEIYQMISEGGSKGMITLEQDLKRLVAESLIKPETALNYANNKKRMSELLKA